VALQIQGSAPAIELHGQYPFIDFSNTVNDYDVRLQTFGGNAGVVGAGTLMLQGSLTLQPAYSSPTVTLQHGFDVTAQASGAPDAPGSFNEGWSANRIAFTDSGVDVSAFAGGNRNTSAFYSNYTTSGGSKGRGVGVFGVAVVNGTPATASNDLNQFVAGEFIAGSNANLGGTDTGAGAVGAVFGFGAGGVAVNNATNLLNVTGGEINAAVGTGASSSLTASQGFRS
jgi:hypothetical protein